MITRQELQQLADDSVNSIATEVEKTIDGLFKKHVANNGMAGSFSYEQGGFSDAVMAELEKRYSAFQATRGISSDGAKILTFTLD